MQRPVASHGQMPGSVPGADAPFLPICRRPIGPPVPTTGDRESKRALQHTRKQLTLPCTPRLLYPVMSLVPVLTGHYATCASARYLSTMHYRVEQTLCQYNCLLRSLALTPEHTASAGACALAGSRMANHHIRCSSHRPRNLFFVLVAQSTLLDDIIYVIGRRGLDLSIRIVADQALFLPLYPVRHLGR